MSRTSGGMDVRFRREMNRAAAALFGTGAIFVLLGVLTARWPGANVAVTITITAIAAATAIGLEVLARTRPLGVDVMAILSAFGTVLVTVVVIAAGPAAAGATGILYVFVASFSFFYYTLRMAIAQVVLLGSGYAVALSITRPEGAVGLWVIVIGAAVMSSALIGTLAQHVRRSLRQEQASVDRLRELDELKNTFLRAISHELRTPLTAVLGYTSTLRDHRHRLPESQVDELLARASSSAQKLGSLLSDLLDVDRIGRGIVEAHVTPTELGSLVCNVVDQINPGRHKMHVNADRVVVPVDPPKIERVVEGLIGNALRHTPPDASVWIEVEATDNGARLTVADDGPGIPEDLREQMFEPFRQGPEAANSASPGTGIGLSLVRRFVELHGGEVTVGDRPGGGTRIRVTLPDQLDLSGV